MGRRPQKPYPETVDGKFPEDWQYILDPLETLTFVAANTDKIALGTSIIDILFHNPVILARRFATLDVLSSGRAIAGFGIGWSEDGTKFLISLLKIEEKELTNMYKESITIFQPQR